MDSVVITPKRYFEKDSDYVEGLRQLQRMHEGSETDFDTRAVKLIENYLDHRDALLTTHKGMYVYVTPESITKIPKTVIDSEKDVPDHAAASQGLFLKVGQEFEISGNAFYASQLQSVHPVLPLSFGERGNDRLWTNIQDVVVDTGLDITTIHVAYLDAIKKIYPRYGNITTTIQNVGGTAQVYQGNIDFDFCGKALNHIIVHFARIPCKALIGQNLLQTGKLDYDPYKWISFTSHC